jgi:hypothetical protein
MCPTDYIFAWVVIGISVTCLIYLVVTNKDDDEQQHRPR